jgi:hypothetical protein
VGFLDQPASRVSPENALVLENIFPPKFLSNMGVTCLFGNFRPRAKKPKEHNFEFWGRA